MRDTFDEALARMRRGDAMKVERLADLAPNIKALRARLDALHKKNCHVLETSTGRRSDTIAIGDMILDAVEVLRKGPPAEVSRANGAKGGRRPKVRTTTLEKAELLWRDPRIPTNKEALKRMPDWSLRALHERFGGSGRPRIKRKRRTKK